MLDVKSFFMPSCFTVIKINAVNEGKKWRVVRNSIGPMTRMHSY